MSKLLSGHEHVEAPIQVPFAPRLSRGSHEGSTLILVTILAMVMASAIFIFISAIGSEGEETSELIWRTRAHEMALGAAARMASAVNQQPWDRKFFENDGLNRVIESDQFPFDPSAPEVAKLGMTFGGSLTCVDVLGPEMRGGDGDPAGLTDPAQTVMRRYQMHLTVSWKPRALGKTKSVQEHYLMAQEEGLFGTSNRDAVRLALAGYGDAGTDDKSRDRYDYALAKLDYEANLPGALDPALLVAPPDAQLGFKIARVLDEPLPEIPPLEASGAWVAAVVAAVDAELEWTTAPVAVVVESPAAELARCLAQQAFLKQAIGSYERYLTDQTGLGNVVLHGLGDGVGDSLVSSGYLEVKFDDPGSGAGTFSNYFFPVGNYLACSVHGSTGDYPRPPKLRDGPGQVGGVHLDINKCFCGCGASSRGCPAFTTGRLDGTSTSTFIAPTCAKGQACLSWQTCTCACGSTKDKCGGCAGKTNKADTCCHSSPDGPPCSGGIACDSAPTE